jgi:hypothetical protein
MASRARGDQARTRRATPVTACRRSTAHGALRCQGTWIRIRQQPSLRRWAEAAWDDLPGRQGRQTVIAFATEAHQVVDLWPGTGGLSVARPLHPSFRDDAGLRADWNIWIPQIRPHVTPDAGVTPDLTPYAGSTFKKADLENIPPRDLPFGVPKWMGPATWPGARRPLRRVSGRRLPPGARRAHRRMLHPSRVEGRPPAPLVILSQLQVIAPAALCRPRRDRAEGERVHGRSLD